MPAISHRHTSIERYETTDTSGPYAQAFADYFGGDLKGLEAIPIVSHGTDFQKSVWKQLLKIPTGQTASYGDIAVKLGKPKAMRAVGMANGRNPISIRVPCHRVIGADGSLTGFGGGMKRKTWLLQHENAL